MNDDQLRRRVIANMKSAAAAAAADIKADAAIADAATADAKAVAAQVTADAAAAAYPVLHSLKCTGTLTDSVDDVEVTLEWTQVFGDSSFSVNRSNITINNTGRYLFNVMVRTTNANRTELIVTHWLDTGESGPVAQTSEVVSGYVSRDTDQNTGSVTFTSLLNLNAGEIVSFRAFGDTDGASSLMTDGTLLSAVRVA